MTIKSRVLSIIMVISILLVSGCKVTLGSQEDNKKNDAKDKAESGNAVKNDESKLPINKNDIDKIEVSFSEQNGNFKRNISIVPNEESIKCTYTSTYLDKNKLETELDQENYDLICNSIKNYNDLNWKTDDVKKYQTETYKVKDLGVCKIKIDSKVYQVDDSSTKKNLCQALLSQILNSVFPLKWESKEKIDKDKYYKVRLCNRDLGNDGEVLDFKDINYVANPNYFVGASDFLAIVFPEDVDKTKKCIEFASNTKSKESTIVANAVTYLTGQEPLEYEYYNLLSKIDYEKMLSSNEKLKLNSEGEIIESAYILEMVDKEENKKKSTLKKETMEKIGQKKPYTDLLDWNEEIMVQFYGVTDFKQHTD